MTFMMGHFANETSGNFRKWLRPKFVNADKKTPFWYNLLGSLMSSFVMNQMVVPFILLDYQKSITVLGGVYFIPEIILASTWFVTGFFARATIKAAKKAAKAAESKTE